MPVATRQKLLYLVSLAALVAATAQTIYTPMLVSVRHDFATSNALIGVSMSVYALMLAFGQAVYGPLVDLFSARRVLTAGLVLFIAASLLTFLAPTIETFIVLRALQALGIGAATVVGGAIIADLFPTEERGRAMGRFQASSAVGGTFGFVVGSTVLLVAGWRFNFLLLAVAGIVVIAGARLLMPSASLRTPHFSFAEASRILLTPASLGIALVGLMQMSANYTFHTFLPLVYHEKAGVPEGLVGYIMMLASVSILAGATIGGRLADRLDRRRLCIAAVGLTLLTTAGVALMAALPASPATLPLITLLMIGHYLSFGGSSPVQYSLMLEWFPAIRGTAVGAFTSLRFFGGTFGPITAGIAVDASGLLWSGFGVATLTLALALVVAVALVAAPAGVAGSARLVPQPTPAAKQD